MTAEDTNVVRPDAFRYSQEPPPRPQPRQAISPIRTGRIFTAAELAPLPVPSRKWLVDGLIPAANVTLLSGDGGAGKSLLALQLAFAMSIAAPWLGRRTVHGSSLFVTAEDSVDEVHRRSADIAAEFNINMRETNNVSLLSLAGEDAVLAHMSGTASLKTSKRFTSLENAVKRLKPSLLVLDTLADFFAGDENNRSQARQFIGLLRSVALQRDCAVLVLAHPSLTGMANKSGLSGSTAWNASVRSRLYLERITDKDGREPDPDLRKLSLVKANYATTGGEILLRWRRGVFQESAASKVSFAVLRDQQEVENLFMEMLDAYQREGRSVGSALSSSFAPAVFAADTRAKGTGKAAFRDAMNRLFDRQEICIEEKGPPSKRRKTIARMTTKSDGE